MVLRGTNEQLCTRTLWPQNARTRVWGINALNGISRADVGDMVYIDFQDEVLSAVRGPSTTKPTVMTLLCVRFLLCEVL